MTSALPVLAGSFETVFLKPSVPPFLSCTERPANTGSQQEAQLQAAQAIAQELARLRALPPSEATNLQIGALAAQQQLLAALQQSQQQH